MRRIRRAIRRFIAKRKLKKRERDELGQVEALRSRIVASSPDINKSSNKALIRQAMYTRLQYIRGLKSLLREARKRKDFVEIESILERIKRSVERRTKLLQRLKELRQQAD